ncbi:bacillithiol system redox-active protein YtxJ [Rhodocaloribacter sp.]|jgi:bacillithiol system protein YtxJ
MPIAFLRKTMTSVFRKKKTPSPFKSLTTEETLREALAHSQTEPVVLFKHSAICGVSFMARRQMVHLSEDDEPAIYELVVQQSRPLSNRIAEMFGIRHQSPQAIVLYRARPVFNTSHGNITTDRIRRALHEARQTQTSDS